MPPGRSTRKAIGFAVPPSANGCCCPATGGSEDRIPVTSPNATLVGLAARHPRLRGSSGRSRRPALLARAPRSRCLQCYLGVIGQAQGQGGGPADPHPPHLRDDPDRNPRGPLHRDRFGRGACRCPSARPGSTASRVDLPVSDPRPGRRDRRRRRPRVCDSSRPSDRQAVTRLTRPPASPSCASRTTRCASSPRTSKPSLARVAGRLELTLGL